MFTRGAKIFLLRKSISYLKISKDHLGFLVTIILGGDSFFFHEIKTPTYSLLREGLSRRHTLVRVRQIFQSSKLRKWMIGGIKPNTYKTVLFTVF